MYNPKVSILIPLYNSESYIAQTIESCINQTYKNVEIIIVDDGSTDKSYEVAKTYESQYPNITLLKQKNAGAPVARNKAFELSKGDYIQYLDADDILDPDKIYKQLVALEEKKKNTIAYSKLGVFNKTIHNTIWINNRLKNVYNDSKAFLLDLWASGAGIFTIMWLTPRELIQNSGGWDETLTKNQDGEFFARVTFLADTVVYVPESISYYRTDNENSISRHVSKKSLQANFDSFETYMNLFKDEINNSNVRESLALVYSKYMFRVYPEHNNLVIKTEDKLRYLGFKKPIIKQGQKYYYLSKIIGIYNVIRIRKLLGKEKLS